MPLKLSASLSFQVGTQALLDAVSLVESEEDFGMQLLYITFLAEFFSDNEGLDMDMMYYSEMKDAGYFEDSYEQF